MVGPGPEVGAAVSGHIGTLQLVPSSQGPPRQLRLAAGGGAGRLGSVLS